LCLLLVACGTPEDRAATYLDKAQALFDAGDFIGAQIEVRNAAQIRPKDARARLLLARLAMERKAYIDALNHLQIAEESDPDLLEVHELLGFIYYYGHATDELAEQVDKANQLAPDDPQVLLLNARWLEATGDKAAALEKLNQSVRADPTDGQAVGFMASLSANLDGPDAGIAVIEKHIEQVDKADTETLRGLKVLLLDKVGGRDDQVEAELKRLAGDFPDNERYSAVLTRFYVAEGRADDAEHIFRNAINQDRADVSRQVDLIQFLAGQGTSGTAEATLKGFIADSPDSPELQLALGQLNDSEGRLDEAVVEYNRTIDMAPRSDESYVARNRIVSVLVRQGKPDEAHDLLEEILAAQPDNEEALLARAAFSFAAGQYEAVIADTRLVARRNPKSESALLLLARAHEALNEPILAQDVYRTILDLNPANAGAATGLAVLLVASGQPAEAQAVLETVVQSDKPDIRALEVMATALLAQGDYTEAESAVQRMIETDPDSGSGDYQFGRIAEARGDVDEALSFYSRELDNNPASAVALQALVSLSLTNGQADHAIEVLQRFITVNPDQPRVRLLLGNAYLQIGERSAAEREYQQVIGNQPNESQAYINLASVYADDSELRYDILRQGLLANPKNMRLGILLGFEYERNGRIEDAISAYEKALTLNPENSFVVNNLAMLLLDNRQDETSLPRAMELAQQFSRSDKANELDTLGWAYYRTGDYPAAVRQLERAVASAGEVAMLRYHLGMAYRAAGDPVQAKAELSKAIELAGQPFAGLEEATANLEELQAQ